MNARIKAAIQHWSYVAPVLQPARNAKEYAALVEALDAALDAGVPMKPTRSPGWQSIWVS